MNSLVKLPDWGLYVIIGGAILLIALLITLIVVLKKKAKRKKEFKEEQKIIDSYYINIIEAVGTLKNIEKVENVGSRLSFYLKDQKLLNIEQLKEIHITGIVKTTKKVTLVVGEMASKYASSIQQEINKEEGNER